MFDLSDICSLCLVLSENLRSVVSKDTDGTVIEEKLRVFILEIVNFKPHIPKYICKNCLENINTMHKFRLKCLENIGTLTKYAHRFEISRGTYTTSQENLLDDHYERQDQKNILNTFHVPYEDFEEANVDNHNDENITETTEEVSNHSRQLEDCDNTSSQPDLRKGKRKITKTRKLLESLSDSDASNLDVLENSYDNQQVLSKKIKTRDSSYVSSKLTGKVDGNEIIFCEEIGVVKQTQSENLDLNLELNIQNQSADEDMNEEVPTAEGSSTDKHALDAIVRNQMKIVAKISNITKKVEHLLNTNISTNSLPDNLPEDLPLRTFTAFMAFENYLSNDNNLRDMFLYLKDMCTSNLGKSLNSMLKLLLTNKLAMEFNYFGKKPKNKFHASRTDKLLYITAKHSFQCNFQEYKDYLMKWLKYAPQREKLKKSADDNNCSLMSYTDISDIAT